MTSQRPLHVCVAALLAIACGVDDDVEWTLVTDLPAGAVLTSTRVSLPAGTALSARAFVRRDGEDVSCDPQVTSRDETVLRAEAATRGVTVFTGVSVGTTELVVVCPGASVWLEGATTPLSGP